MRYARETTALLLVGLITVAVLVFIGYRERPETPGDNTPLEHDIGGDPPPELREQ